MDRTTARRGLILLSSPLILWILLRKSWVQLVLALLLYVNAESWLSVKPYGLIEFVEFFAANTDAFLSLVGLVVAVAAGKGFIESKQLDLKLALEAEVSDLMAEGSQLIRTCSLAAESMVEVESLARGLVIEAQSSNVSPVVFPVRVEGAYHKLLRRSVELPKAQDGFESVLNRFMEMERKWAAVIRSNLITSLAIEKAKAALSSVSSAASMLEPQRDWTIEEFLIRQERHWGTSAEDFIVVANANQGKFNAWMGAASGMGSSSIFPASVLITIRLWWRLYQMRE